MPIPSRADHRWTALALTAALLGLVACTAPDPGPEDPGDLSSDWTYTPAPQAAPCLDAEQVGPALEAMVARLLTLDPAPLLDAYARYVALADGSCPAMAPANQGPISGELWNDRCYTAAGAEFRGVGRDFDYTPGAYYDGFRVEQGQGVYMSGEMSATDGQHLAGTGFAARLALTLTTAQVDMALTEYAFNGIFDLNEEGAAESWLNDGSAPRFAVDWGRELRLGINWLQLRGSATLPGPDGEPGTTIDFGPGLTFYKVPLSPCNNEPTGTVGLRCASGEWLEVAFDGPDILAGQTEPSGDCDGQGAVTHRGETLGTTLFGVLPFMTWTNPPWPGN